MSSVIPQADYYIYLDTKMIGAVRQLISFFEQNVFAREKAVVIIKDCSQDKRFDEIKKALKQNKIIFRVIKLAQVDEINKGFVLYLFNAQSNCRVVANRKLIHIFVTHGESNKKASIKPILRIYDHVATAGCSGIDRLIQSKIFSQNDIDRGRIIVMGDTFVGGTGLSSVGGNVPCIFYAPTWEGGVASENYSSLKSYKYVARLIEEARSRTYVDTVVFRPHPNLGYRDKKYRAYLFGLIKMLIKQNLKVVLYCKNNDFTVIDKMRFKAIGVVLSNSLSQYYARLAFCDVSAIESQLLNESIPYYLLTDADEVKNSGGLYMDHKGEHVIEISQHHHLPDSLDVSFYRNLLSKRINLDMRGVAMSDRMNYLFGKTNNNFSGDFDEQANKVN